MILKEAFRTQNFLDSLINTALSFLSQQDNIVCKKQEHLRKKSNPEAENEIVEVPKSTVFESSKITPNVIIDFVMDLICEKEKLTKAIADAKSNTEIDIDSSITLNRLRQNVANTFSYMSGVKASEQVFSTRGRKFNINGDEVPYSYDVKEVTTIDFDRNKVKALARKLNTQSDTISTKLDLLNVTIEVDYTPKYEIGDSFEDCIITFLN